MFWINKENHISREPSTWITKMRLEDMDNALNFTKVVEDLCLWGQEVILPNLISSHAR